MNTHSTLRAMVGKVPSKIPTIPPTAIQPGYSYVIKVNASAGGDVSQALPPQLAGASVSKPDASGVVNITGTYNGKTSYTPPVAFQIGTALYGHVYYFPVLSVTSTPSVILGLNPTFTQKPGRRIITALSAAGGALPDSYVKQTKTSYQALLDKNHPGQYVVNSVIIAYVGTTPQQLVVDQDYCGTQVLTLPQSGVTSAGSVTLTETIQDAGPATHCGVVAPVGGGMSTGTKVAIILALLLGGTYVAYEAGAFA